MILVVILVAILYGSGCVDADVTPAATRRFADARAVELAPVVEELVGLVNRNATFRAQIARILDERNMRNRRRSNDDAKRATTIGLRRRGGV